MKAVENFVSSWAGALVCVTHLCVLSAWHNGDVTIWSYGVFSITLLITLIVLIARKGYSLGLALGMMLLMAHTVFMSVAGIISTQTLTQIYIAALIALAINDVIYNFLRTTQPQSSQLQS